MRERPDSNPTVANAPIPASASSAGTLDFSVIIPTYQRRDLVAANVSALARQSYRGRFEVIVVDDGSTDGTADALRALRMPFPLVVHQQLNSGSAAARNAGAARATGRLLLFLDDDMEAHPDLLAEHDAAHRAGAEAVMGHIPIHPASPPGLLAQRVSTWAEERAARLGQPGAELGLDDMLTGQLSVAKALFTRLSGFDANFRQKVSSGNADTDFGCRLLKSGGAVIFNPRAISWQMYVVSPQSYLKRFREVGRADVRFVEKHPDQFDRIFTARKLGERRPWMVPLAAAGLRVIAIRLVASGRTGRTTARWFSKARWCEYWLGVAEAGGVPRPS